MDYPDKSRTLGAALTQWAQETPDGIALRHNDVIVDWQTYDRHATQVANGAARIRLSRFLAVLTPVSAGWAALQTVVGVAVWQVLLGG